jgi:hypothetical protein
MDAREVRRYRVEDALPINGLVAGTAGVVAGTTTGVVAGTTTGVVAGTTTGVVAGTPLMDAHPVTRYRAETAHPTDLEGEAARTYFLKIMRGASRRISPSCPSLPLL